MAATDESSVAQPSPVVGASNASSPSRAPLRRIDPATALAIQTALAKVDTTLRRNQLYNPEDKSMTAKEDVGPALNILRGWMRTVGLSAIDTFNAWDHAGTFTLTRSQLQKGFEQDLGVLLDDELVTLVFDHLSSSYHLSYDEWKTWFYGTSIDMGETDEERRDKAALIIERWVRVYVAKKSAEKRRLARRAERKAAQAAAAAAEQGGGAAVGMLGGAAEIV